jgi:hypothetical protein
MSNILIDTISDTQNSLKLAESKLNHYEYTIGQYLKALELKADLANFSEAVVMQECNTLLKSMLESNLKD